MSDAAKPEARPKYTIGGNLDKDIIEAARVRFVDAPQHRILKLKEGITYPYITLDDEENYKRKVVDHWLERHGESLDGTFKLNIFAILRTNALPAGFTLPNGIREEPGPVVLIPLQTWNSDNACVLPSTTLLPGTYIMLDGCEPVRFPPSKVGALLICLIFKPATDIAPD